MEGMRTTFGKLDMQRSRPQAARRSVAPAGRSEAAGPAASTRHHWALLAALLVLLTGLVMLRLSLAGDLPIDEGKPLFVVGMLAICGGGYWIALSLGLIRQTSNSSGDTGAVVDWLGSSDGDGDCGGDGGGD